MTDNWQPIETAPKDGTDVHVICAGRWRCSVPAYYISAEYLKREYGDPEYMETGWSPSNIFLFDLPEVTLEPTHWTPLPPPPLEEKP
jgi:hypothetical protein